MLLDELVEKMQAKLVENNKVLENIDDRREMIENVSQEEVSKITAECDAIKERVGSIGEMSQKKARGVFSDLDRMLLDRREVVRTGSLVLCPEIDKLVESGDDKDLEDCWEKVKEVVESEMPDVDVTVPEFFPSSSLSTIKNSDIGVICLAEFPPNQFEVLIASPPMRQLNSETNTMKVFCMIKTDQLFTENIQNHVKFSIKNLNSKNPVTYCNEDCKMAEDKKSFSITFLATESGKYKVTALLYGEHITSSPLIIPVTVSVQEIGLVEKKDEETNKDNSDLDNNASELYPDPSIITAPPPSSLPSPLDLQKVYRDQGKLICYKVFSIETGSKPGNICKPIGMCVLHNKNIVVATTFDDKVRMFSPSGTFLSFVTLSNAPFSRPTDMLTLHSGEFVVRDDNKVTVLTEEGKFLRTLWQDKGHVKCYGLAQDKEDRVITIMCNRSQRRTELLFFDLASGELVKKIDMEDIIAEKDKSKCRFLTYQLGKLYITDLGLDCVYVLDPVTNTVKVRFNNL